MYHLDIPKTRQYDTGKIEVIARNSVGETLATADLKIVPRSDDYRGVLKNSPKRKFITIINNKLKFITCLLYEIIKKSNTSKNHFNSNTRMRSFSIW